MRTRIVVVGIVVALVAVLMTVLAPGAEVRRPAFGYLCDRVTRLPGQDPWEVQPGGSGFALFVLSRDNPTADPPVQELCIAYLGSGQPE